MQHLHYLRLCLLHTPEASRQHGDPRSPHERHRALTLGLTTQKVEVSLATQAALSSVRAVGWCQCADFAEPRARPLLPLMLPDSALWREPCREPPRPPTTPDSLLSRPVLFPSPSSLCMFERQRVPWSTGDVGLM